MFRFSLYTGNIPIHCRITKKKKKMLNKLLYFALKKLNNVPNIYEINIFYLCLF